MVNYKNHQKSILKIITPTRKEANILDQCTEVRFASLLSGEFTTMTVINPPEKKLAKRTSEQCLKRS